MPLNADPEVVLAAIEVWMPAYKLALVDLLANREFAIEVLKKTRGANIDRVQHWQNFFASLPITRSSAEDGSTAYV